MLLVKSHTYTINMDNCAYFRAGRSDEGIDGKGKESMTIFTMNNGSVVQITCDYDTVAKQISHHYSFSTSYRGRNNVITLNY